MNLYWNSVHDFLAMGGYGPYVWSSFGVMALCIVIEVVTLRQRGKALLWQPPEGDAP
jgi:heme exporter protein D